MTDLAAIKAELRALLAAATPGPWKTVGSRDTSPDTAADVGIVSEALPYVPGVSLSLVGEVFAERRKGHPDAGAASADAALIVALRNNAAALLADTPSVEPPCVHEWEDGPGDEEEWYCLKCGTIEHPGEGVHEDDVLAAEDAGLRPSVEPAGLAEALDKINERVNRGIGEGSLAAARWRDALIDVGVMLDDLINDGPASLLPTQASDKETT